MKMEKLSCEDLRSVSGGTVICFINNKAKVNYAIVVYNVREKIIEYGLRGSRKEALEFQSLLLQYPKFWKDVPTGTAKGYLTEEYEGKIRILN